MIHRDFYQVDDMTDLYVDAAVCDNDNRLLFLSVWGLDTAVQAFIARLAVSRYDQGLSSFYLKRDKLRYRCHVPDANHLVKQTGRAPKHALFDQLVHVWLHDSLATTMDYANRQSLVLKNATETTAEFEQRLWRSVQTLCPVPLLPEWQYLMELFKTHKWISYHEGIAVDAVQLNFASNEVENVITKAIQSGLVTLPKKGRRLSLVSA